MLLKESCCCQRATVLRAYADPDGGVSCDRGEPRAASGGDIAPGLPLEAASRDRPRPDEREPAHQPASPQAHTA